jgi:ribosomal protein S18 acetylase RimI-like enzyme
MVTLAATLTAGQYIKQLYVNAFPKNERRLWSKQCELLKQQQLRLLLVKNDDQTVGFIFFWQLSGFAFVEHFAIDPAARGEGIGSAVMNQLAETLQSIVLEVELPVTEMAKRRIAFYERLGYQTFPDAYYQPPYNPKNLPLELRLMHLGIPPDLSFEKIKHELYNTVYK